MYIQQLFAGAVNNITRINALYKQLPVMSHRISPVSKDSSGKLYKMCLAQKQFSGLEVVVLVKNVSSRYMYYSYIKYKAKTQTLDD